MVSPPTLRERQNRRYYCTLHLVSSVMMPGSYFGRCRSPLWALLVLHLSEGGHMCVASLVLTRPRCRVHSLPPTSSIARSPLLQTGRSKVPRGRCSVSLSLFFLIASCMYFFLSLTSRGCRSRTHAPQPPRIPCIMYYGRSIFWVGVDEGEQGTQTLSRVARVLGSLSLDDAHQLLIFLTLSLAQRPEG